MRIYSMTATFGKLNHQTLTLQPGMNVLPAPNEWGKSTWCAFLINMLYGIDTKQRAAGMNLPDKTRYAPWSGAPMSGRIELNWNGRDITIERSSTARVPFGEFRAFETHTGLEVPELDGTNCGKMLLGVERSVFTRAGFIRHTDMPVSADDALRRRLNDLVSTGDDSGDGDRLGSILKDLKNKCRFNNTGLLPQAETERDQQRRQLDQILDLQNMSAQLQQRQSALTQRIGALTNHETTLRFNAAKEDAARVAQAKAAVEASRKEVEQLQAQLALLPDPAQAQPALDAGNDLNRQLEELQLEKRLLPPAPTPINVPAHFKGLTPQQALVQSQAHYDRHLALNQKQHKAKSALTSAYVLMGVSVLAAIAGLLLSQMVITGVGAAVLVLSAVLLITTLTKISGYKTVQTELQAAHPGLTPQQWVADAQDYLDRENRYQQAKAEHDRRVEDLSRRETLLVKQIQLFVGEGTLQQRLTQWNQALETKKQLDAALARLKLNEDHLQALEAMVRIVDAPACPDQLSLSMEQTLTELEAARLELQQVQQQLHQCKGRSEAMGQEAVVRSRLDTLLRRISRLEDTYYALEMAQEALYQATTTLQRRFAPKISKRAQELFGLLTDGRYDRLSLSEDFTLNVGAQDEDTLHGAQWRSDGTADQLYLALRLAVAEALTPDAPLILDDALVRFDDQRAAHAMELLKGIADQKQIILFSCHERETNYI